jgi:hypothetical protein
MSFSLTLYIYIRVQIQIHSKAKRIYLFIYLNKWKSNKKRSQTYAPLHSIFFSLILGTRNIYSKYYLSNFTFFPSFFVFIFYGPVILLSFFVLFIFCYNLYFIFISVLKLVPILFLFLKHYICKDDRQKKKKNLYLKELIPIPTNFIGTKNKK